MSSPRFKEFPWSWREGPRAAANKPSTAINQPIHPATYWSACPRGEGDGPRPSRHAKMPVFCGWSLSCPLVPPFHRQGGSKRRTEVAGYDSSSCTSGEDARERHARTQFRQRAALLYGPLREVQPDPTVVAHRLRWARRACGAEHYVRHPLPALQSLRDVAALTAGSPA